ncbi:complement regulator-acquiring protein [Borreliella burgdorferi]|uniref:complement regulator-acquiring protein n=1 Tax=Borreliella burgdorferi TaxID=139 RepID=UPI003013D14C
MLLFFFAYNLNPNKSKLKHNNKFNLITTNLNTTKLSIIVATLTLICISCAVSPMAPEVNSYTNTKEDTENLKNASGDINSLSQKSLKEVTIAKLKEFGNKLTAQKNEETTKIEKITAEKESDLLETLDSKIQPVYFTKPETTEETKNNVKMQIKRIIYSSLDYDKGEIKKLKEIIEKVKGKDGGEYMIIDLLYGKALDIQTQIDKHLESTKEDNKIIHNKPHR